MAVKRYGLVIGNEKKEYGRFQTDANGNKIGKTYIEVLDNITSSLKDAKELGELFKEKMPEGFNPDRAFISFQFGGENHYKYAAFNNKLIYQVSSFLLEKINEGSKDSDVPIDYIYDNRILSLLKDLKNKNDNKYALPYRIQDLLDRYEDTSMVITPSEEYAVTNHNHSIDKKIVNELTKYCNFRDVVVVLNAYYKCFQFGDEKTNGNDKLSNIEDEIRYLSYIKKVIKIYGFDAVNSKNFFSFHEFVDAATGRLVTKEELEADFEKYKKANNHI